MTCTTDGSFFPSYLLEITVRVQFLGYYVTFSCTKIKIIHVMFEVSPLEVIFL